MSQRTRKRIIAVVSIIIAIIIGLSCITPVLFANAAEPSLDTQYSALQKQQKDLESKQAALKDKLKDNSDDQDTIKQQISLINENMSSLKQQMDILGNRIGDCNSKIAEKNSEIEKTQQDITKNTEIYKERVCALYEVGTVSRMQVLLSSTSIKDFLSRTEIMKMIQSHDKALIDKLSSDIEKLQSEKTEVEAQKKKLDASKTELQKKQSTYEDQYKESSALYSKLKDSETEIKSQIDKADAEEDEANKQLADIIKQKEEEARKKAEAQAQANKNNSSSNNSGSNNSGSNNSGSNNNSGSSNNNNSYVGGEWLWPIQNISCYISSAFGPRPGHSVPHSGIDIAAAGIKGHPILASNSGTVIIADYGTRIYGNYVVIDHGGGLTSLYGHCESLNVSVGQTVKKGQVVGTVGNTGNVVSLGGGGYHLHFQIMKNGTPVNPMNYVSH